jgi:YidC/Oxa1 family membrane protein insertase
MNSSIDQQRFILAMALSAGVLIVWQVFFAPEPPESKAAADTREQAAQKGEADPGASASDDETSNDDSGSESESATASAETGEGTESGESAARADESTSESDGALGTRGESSADSRDVEVRTHVLTSTHADLEFTNARGGRLKSIELKKPEQYTEKGDLLGAFPDKSTHYPLRVRFADNRIPVSKEATFSFDEEASVARKDGGYRKLVYYYQDPDERFRIDKIFTLPETPEEKPYTVRMKVRIDNQQKDRRLGDTLSLDLFKYKDPDVERSFFNFRPNTIEGICRTSAETHRSAIGELEGALSYDESSVLWGGAGTRYFLTAALPEDSAESCSIERIDDHYLRTRLTYDAFTIQPGGAYTLEHTLYMGPKDLDLLSGLGEQYHMTDSVDYGLFAFIAWPLHVSLKWIQGNLVGNWGLAIILLTLIIKLLTWPINMKAYRSMQGMKEIQPKMEEIREKYSDDQQRMTEETMKLFRENDVSPMGGCLPMILQMPILYGLYVMIYNSVELYQANFLVWTNLAAPDPYYVLPVSMGVIMFGQQQFMGAGGTSNMQAKIMTKVMPIMFTAFMLFLPAGLVLYYSINLLIGLGQQFYIRYEPDDEDDED